MNNHFPERCTFPEHSGCYAVNNPEAENKRMDVAIVTWTCPDTGRFWRRYFPQTKYMADWEGKRNLFKCLKNLDVRGTPYRIETIERTAFNWK